MITGEQLFLERRHGGQRTDTKVCFSVLVRTYQIPNDVFSKLVYKLLLLERTTWGDVYKYLVLANIAKTGK